MTDFAVPNAKPGKCAKCNGSGVYRWGGGTVNGKFNGHSGACHSCGGSGEQSHSDIARNKAFNRHQLRRAFNLD